VLPILRNVTAAFVIGTLLGVPFGVAAASSDHRTFDGRVVHVSGENLKVTGIEGGKTQTISFLMVSHVRKIFKRKGSATTQMQDIKPGDFVRVTFDQKFLGLRHADEIIDSDAPLKPLHS
jgi:hypothetical protein